MATKRELIILIFYVSVEGLSKQMAEERIYKLVNSYDNSQLPDDVAENYHIEHYWIPIKKGQSRVELIYPTKFQLEGLEIDEVDKLVEQIQKYKQENIK